MDSHLLNRIVVCVDLRPKLLLHTDITVAVLCHTLGEVSCFVLVHGVWNSIPKCNVNICN